MNSGLGFLRGPLSRPEEGEVRLAARHAQDEQPGFPEMVVAPLARLPARHPRTLGYVVPPVRAMVDGVEEQALVSRVLREVRTLGIDERGQSAKASLQVAVLTERIKYLTAHLKVNKHDFHTRRGLLMLVGQRRRHLRYLNRRDVNRYREVISRLGLRK